MISVKNLRKTYDNFVALDSFSMSVKKGSIYGLVGPNGAGKTTLLNHISGIYVPDEGQVEIDGKQIFENIMVKEKIAFIPDDLKHYTSYTPKSAAKMYSKVYPGWDQNVFDGILDIFKLSQDRKISKMSKGMQKQVVFALSLATKPEYLILDEPIDGLDPLVRKQVWQYIVDAAADRGMTTLISSHNLKEMEGICDSIGIISKGKMVMERDLDDMKTGIHKVQVSFKGRPDPDYKGLNILHREVRGAVELLVVRNDKNVLSKFEKKYDPLLFDVLPLSLEEIFIYELGGDIDETNQKLI